MDNIAISIFYRQFLGIERRNQIISSLYMNQSKKHL